MKTIEIKLDELKKIIFNIHINKRLDAIDFLSIVEKLLIVECEINNFKEQIVVLPDMLSVDSLKEVRKKLCLSMRDVTKKTGISGPTISRIERGINKSNYKQNLMKLNIFYSNAIKEGIKLK